MRRRLGLRSRITLVTVAVATLAVVVTGAVSLQLVRQSSVDEARTTLAASATLLSKVRVSAAELTAGKVVIAQPNVEFGSISPNGTVNGDAAGLLRPLQVAKLLRGGSVSSLATGPLGIMLVEARPSKGGGAVVLALPRDTVELAARAAALRIALALLVGLAVAVIAGLILARWLAKPLVDAARTARRMARGERGVPVSKSGPAEIVDVADALAALDSALTSSEARQREFLLSISHELRTPLTALRGYAEALADGVVPAGDIAAVGATLVSETQRLDRFVADLLELARLEADDFSISVDTVDVGAMLSSTCETWLGRASALGVDLVASSSTIITTTDPRRLRQILDGLVENALRVTPAGEEIRLSAHAELARVVIEVRDGGPGISAEDAAVAFDRGVLRDRYRDVRPVGTGLGLSIAARLAKRLGGTISAAGLPGGGSAFTVTLPY